MRWTAAGCLFLMACAGETRGLLDQGIVPQDAGAAGDATPTLDAPQDLGVELPDARVASDAADVDLDSAAADDLGVADGSEPTIDAGDIASAVSLCPVPDMDSVYSGFLPTNPYEAPDDATECMRARHDVIIVLGCPNNEDGSPADCQVERADIAVSLAASGFGSEFIVSGAAVHNSYVEAQTLHDLLVARGVATEHIFIENRAEHTDENIYFSTQIMEDHAWQNALIVSEDPGHLIMSAVCDSNCCVDLGRLTVASFPVTIDSESTTKAVAHYVRYPYASDVSDSECSQIELPTKLMCTNLSSRRACAGSLMVE